MVQHGYDGPRRSFSERAMAAARLDSGVFEEVEADKSATGQAAAVVGLAAVASAIGNSGHGTTAMIAGLIAAFVAWIAWSAITWFIGATLFKVKTADVGELMRTLGFAQAAGVLNILGIIPFFGVLIRLIVAIWILIAGVIAIRQALDFSTGKAVITAIVGWLVVACASLLVGGLAFFS